MTYRLLTIIALLIYAGSAGAQTPDAVTAPAEILTEGAAGAEEDPDEIPTILGRPEISIDRMYFFVKARNPNFIYDIAEAFYVIGERYGIRGDIAFCQAVLETGWFRFIDGTAVEASQHNYGGLGVTSRGERGNEFTTLHEGVTAQIQHLYAYACSDALPEGEELVDKRFDLVRRGCAPTWNDLSGRWAMNDHYGDDILRIYSSLERFEMPEHHDLDDDNI